MTANTGQGFYFHLNHPVKWVRIAGVVVGVDEYPGRHIYTVDDGSGATIECVVRVAPRPQAEQLGGMDAAQAAERLRQAGEAAKAAADKVSIDATIDVGHVLQVQGLVKVFRDVKQVEATKVVHLLSTEQEVEFWTRLHRFRGDIIGRPWTLDRETVRRCRKKAEGPCVSPRSRPRRRKDSSKVLWSAEPQQRVRRTTGLEKRVKRRPASQVEVEGTFDALGL